MNTETADGANVKIVATGISKIFYLDRGAEIHAMGPIDLDIRKGEFICIVGPSGCGKTTLLRILAQLEKQSEGIVTISQGDPTKPLTAMVFQEQSVFPWMTVEDNVAYGLRMRGMKKKDARAAAAAQIKLTGLSQFARAYPNQLSGGMKQRVSVARAFAVDPEILLMDEPFGALDEQNRLLLQQELLRIWEANRKTAVFITHSIDEALALGDRVLVMSARPGTVKAIIKVDLPRPRRITEIRKSPAFNDYYMDIWSALEDEVLKAQENTFAAAGKKYL